MRDVTTADRVLTAMELRRRGVGWVEIARQCGYNNPGTAHKAVQRELARTIAINVEEYRREEVDRLDQFLSVYYPKAMAGDGWSMDRCLRLMERRAALLGLDTTRDQQLAQQLPVRREYTVRAS